MTGAGSTSTTGALAVVILAAGRGSRLRPLTDERPKPLCPVGTTTGLHRWLDVLADRGLRGRATVAVNAHHLAGQIIDAVGLRATVAVEPRPLGTAGAIGNLRSWIDGRDVLIGNADAWLADPGDAVTGLRRQAEDRPGVPWLTCVEDTERGDFGSLRFAGLSLLPGRLAEALPARPLGLYEAVWRHARQQGELGLWTYPGGYRDLGTLADYLAVNLDPKLDLSPARRCRDRNVIGPGAVVAGRIRGCVVWPGARVGAQEQLTDAVRTSRGRTARLGADGA